jgi:hypothetical protein
LQQVQWEDWIVQPGFPPVEQDFSSPVIGKALQLAEGYIVLQGQASPNGYQLMRSWFPNEKYIFLEYLSSNYDRLNARILQKIDNDFQFTTNTNKEILFRWFRACILGGY